MNTKKEILTHFKDRVSQITYDIEYYSYKNNDIVKLNLIDKRKLIIDIGISIGIENSYFLDWIKNGQLTLDKDINDSLH